MSRGRSIEEGGLVRGRSAEEGGMLDLLRSDIRTPRRPLEVISDCQSNPHHHHQVDAREFRILQEQLESSNAREALLPPNNGRFLFFQFIHLTVFLCANVGFFILAIPREPLLPASTGREPLIPAPMEPFHPMREPLPSSVREPLIPPPLEPLIPPPAGLGRVEPLVPLLPSPPSARREGANRPREVVLGEVRSEVLDYRQGRQEMLGAGEYRQGREAFEELRLGGEGRGHGREVESRQGRELVIGELPKRGEQGSSRGAGEMQGVEEQARPGKEVEARGRIGDIKVGNTVLSFVYLFFYTFTFHIEPNFHFPFFFDASKVV